MAQGDEYLGAYVILSLTTGIRTEQARAMRWDHFSLDGDPATGVPPHMAVWRSVRARSDTKTERSRRTLGLPQSAVVALREQWERQVAARLAAGELWQDHGLVFTSSTGKPLDDANVRRGFRAVCQKAGIGGSWSPRSCATRSSA
jgi:integrase